MTTKLAALIGATLLAAKPSELSGDFPRSFYKRNKSRGTGQANPAGSKLAKKAAKGKLGIR